jgi:hypothetical protein
MKCHGKNVFINQYTFSKNEEQEGKAGPVLG